MENITQDQFEAYVNVQMSGVTNMMDLKTVSELSGLERQKIITIIRNYNKLQDKYGN